MKKIVITFLIFCVFILFGFNIKAKEVNIVEIQNNITDTSTISDDFKLMGLDINNYPSLYLKYEKEKLENGNYNYDRYNNDVSDDDYLGVNPAYYYDKWYCVGICEKYDSNMNYIDIYIYFYNPYATAANSFSRYKDENSKLSFNLQINITTKSLEDSIPVSEDYNHHGVSQINASNQMIPYDNSPNTFLNKSIGEGDEYQNKNNPFEVMVIKKVGKLSSNIYREYNFKSLEVNNENICKDKLQATFITKYNDNNTIIDISYDYDSTMVITRDRIVTLTLDYGSLDKDTISRLLLSSFGVTGILADLFMTENQYASMSLFFYNFDSNKKFDELLSVSFNYNLYHYHVNDWWVKDKTHLPTEYVEKERIIKPEEINIEWGGGNVWGSNNIKQDGKFNTIITSDAMNRRVDEIKPYSNKIEDNKQEFNYQASILFDYSPYLYSNEYWGAKATWDYYDVSNVTVGEMVYKYEGVTYKAKVIDDANDDDNIKINPDVPNESNPLVDLINWLKNNPEAIVGIIIGIVLLILFVKFMPQFLTVGKYILKGTFNIFKFIFYIIWYPIKYLGLAIYKLFHKRE